MTCIFFFNDTATTDTYTYLHTLSLHDALPIFLALGGHHCSTRGRLVRGMAEPSADRVVRGGPARGLEEIGGLGAGGPCFCQSFGEREAAQREEELVRFYHGLVLWRVGRSEEHTSELQSLMRISSAVICLTKKH